MKNLKNFFLRIFGQDRSFIWKETPSGDETFQQSLDDFSKKAKEGLELAGEQFDKMNADLRRRLEEHDPKTEELSRAQVDERIAQKAEHLEVITTKELSGEEIEGKFLEDIAEEFGMTYEELLDLNTESADFHIVEAKNKKHYCYRGDRIVVNLTPEEVEERQTNLAQVQEEILEGVTTSEERETQAKEAREERDTGREELLETRTAEEREAMEENYRSLLNRKTRLPLFLRRVTVGKSREDWARALARADQAEDASAKRVVELLDDPPLSIGEPSQFRDIIETFGTGDIGVLHFKELTKYQYGETQVQFFKRVDALTKELYSAEVDLQITRSNIETSEEIITDLTGIPRNEDETAAEYDTRLGEEMDRMEDLTEEGANQVVRALAKLKRYDNQVADFETKIPELRSDLDDRVAFMVQADKVLTAMAETVEGEEFEQQEIEEEIAMSEEELATLELGENLFEDLGYTPSRQEAYAGGIAYRKLDDLDRDAGAEFERHRTRRTSFDVDSGEEHVDHERLMADYDHFLATGLENFFQGEEFDPMELIEDLDIDMVPDEAAEARKLTKDVNRLSRRKGEFLTRKKEIEDRLANRERRGLPTAAAEARYAETMEELDSMTEEIAEKNARKIEIFAPYMEMAKAVLAIQETSADDVNEWQQRLVQHGYDVSQGMSMEELILETEERVEGDVEAVLEKYADHAVIAQVFALIQQEGAMDVLTASDLKKIASKVEAELRGGIEVDVVQGPEKDTFLFAAAAMGEYTEGVGTTGFRAGIGRPFPVPGVPGMTIDLGIGGGYTVEGGVEAGATGGVSQEIDVSRDMNITVGVKFGGSFRGGEAFAGVSGKATVAVESRGFGASATFRGGASVRLEGGVPVVTPGAALTLSTSFQDMDRLRTVTENKALAMTGGDFMESSEFTDGQKAEMIAGLPGFEGIAAKLTEVTPRVRTQILLDMFSDHLQANKNKFMADMEPFPIGGFSVTLIPAPPFVLPMINIQIAGKAKVYFAVPDDPQAIFKESNSKVHEAIQEQMGDNQDYQLIEDMTLLSHTVRFSEMMEFTEMDENEGFLVAQEAYTISGADLLAGALESYNSGPGGLNQNGINLETGSGETAGLTRLDLHGIRGECDIRLDPALEEMFMTAGPGDPPTREDIHMGFNALDANTNLVVTREEIIYPRKQYGDYYKYTRITIKASDTPSGSFDQFEDLQGGRISFQDNSQLDVSESRYEDAQGEEFNNVYRNWEEYQETRAELVEAGLVNDMDEFDAEMARLRAEVLDGGSVEIRSAALDEKALPFFRANRKECLNWTLTNPDASEFNANSDALEGLAREFLTEQGMEPQNDLEVKYFMSVVRNMTYVKSGPEKRAKILQNNEKLFRTEAANLLGETVANQVADDLEKEPEGITVAIPRTAETFTVVSRGSARGTRADTFQARELLNATDYSDHDEMRTEMVQKLRPIDQMEPRDLLRSSIGVKTREVYYLLKGPEAQRTMNELFENPDLLEDPAYAETFAEFQETIRTLRASEIADKPVSIETHYGATIDIKMNARIYGGQLDACNNLTVSIDENIAFMVGGEAVAATAVIEEKMTGEVRKDTYSLAAGGTGIKKEPPITPPPPPKAPSEKEEKGGGTDVKVDPNAFDRETGDFEGGEEDTGEGDPDIF